MLTPISHTWVRGICKVTRTGPQSLWLQMCRAPGSWESPAQEAQDEVLGKAWSGSLHWLVITSNHFYNGMRYSQSWVPVSETISVGRENWEEKWRHRQKEGVIAAGYEQPRIVLRAKSCTTKNVSLQVTLGIQCGLFFPPTGTLNLVKETYLL